MSEIQNVIRVFLASPGDLKEEREIVKNVVGDINATFPTYLCYQIELMGWEDTVSSYGRPQEIINQDLKKCDLFIGLMWKLWGTPTGSEEQYTSGFEEEYTLSVTRREQTGKPEISLYFKEIVDNSLDDPGPGLKQVIAFKNKIIKDKSLLFNVFRNSNEFERTIRKKLETYIFETYTAQQKEQSSEIREKNQKPDSGNNLDSAPQNITNPLSNEGHRFLAELIQKTNNPETIDKITPFDIARFRLLANSIAKQENDQSNLGSHDANIIFLNKNTNIFGYSEISKLEDCGLVNIKYGNAPLWHWYSLREKHKPTAFIFKALNTSKTKVCVGTLEAMWRIGMPIDFTSIFGKEYTGKIKRSDLLTIWLAKNTENNIKIAALKYLKDFGLAEDLHFIQAEFDTGNIYTSKLCIEAILQIKLRENVYDAAKFAITTQFEHVDENLLGKIFSVRLGLPENEIRMGLEHRCASVRLACINLLHAKKALSLADGQKLSGDSDAHIRRAAIDIISNHGTPLSLDDVSVILSKRQNKQEKIFFSLFSDKDPTEQKLFDDYMACVFSKKNEQELLTDKDKSPTFKDLSFFTLCNKYFGKYSEILRENIDDQFKKYYQNSVKNREPKLGILSQELLKLAPNIEENSRKQLTRKGLDILCSKGYAEDLARGKKNLKEKFTESSEIELTFFKKLGNWNDIPNIAQLKKPHDKYKNHSFLNIPIDGDWNILIAKTILELANSRIIELLKLNLPDKITIELLKVIPISRFSNIAADIILKLLTNKNDSIREICSFKCIQSFNKTNLQRVFDEYLNNNENIYYNVIHWLDFGLSTPQTISRKSIRRILGEQ